MLAHLNHSWQIKHCNRQLWVGSGELMGQGTSAPCRGKYNRVKNEWLGVQELRSVLRYLLTAKITGCFEAREIEGCRHSLSSDLCNTMHGTHESKCAFLIAVESVLGNRNTINNIKGVSKAVFFNFVWQFGSPGTDRLLPCQKPCHAGWFHPSQHTPGVRTEATPFGHSAGYNPEESEEHQTAGSAGPKLGSRTPVSGTLGEEIKSHICQACTVTITQRSIETRAD